MTKRLQSITDALYPLIFVALLLGGWWMVCRMELVPAFMLPSPAKVLDALVTDAPALMQHALISLQEAAVGLTLAVLGAFVMGVLMDRFVFLYKSVYPVAILTQTVPSIAIAPLLVLWLGYGMTPKVVLIFITCFFPLLIGLLGGLQTVDHAMIKLFASMGASWTQILWQVKLPYAMESFFAGLRISAAYSIVGAVIAEWLGGEGGLGVYMTRVRKAYAFDKMFAVIFLISILSLLAVKLVELLQKKSMPWKQAV